MGNYNSGTTLLAHLLGCHPDISALNTEGASITDQIRTPEDFGYNRLWFKVEHLLRIGEDEYFVDAKKVIEDWIQLFDATKDFFLEKSIINGLNIEWINRNFNDPHFIWIVRNGYASAEGIRRRTGKRSWWQIGKARYPIEDCAKQWVVSNDRIAEALSGIEKKTVISYEELSSDTTSTINRILDDLELEHMLIDGEKRFWFQGEEGRIYNRNSESIRRLSRDDIVKINSIASPSLKRFGYPILGGDN